MVELRVIPAKAGIPQQYRERLNSKEIPAYAGMTNKKRL